LLYQYIEPDVLTYCSISHSVCLAVILM